MGSSELSLQSQTLGWQAVTAVEAKQDAAQVVAALATCSSFSEGTIQVRVNESSSARGRTFDTNKSVMTSIESIPLIFRKVFQREFALPLESTLVLDLSILQSQEVDVGALSINAASLALYSAVFRGAPPLGAVSIAVVDGEAVVSPSKGQMTRASMNMMYAGREGAPVYFHASGEATAETLISALRLANGEVSRIAKSIEDYVGQGAIDKEADLALGTAEDLVAIACVRDFLDYKVSDFLAGQVFLEGGTFNLLGLNSGLGELKRNCIDYFRKIGAFRSPLAKIAGSGCVTKEEVELGFSESVKWAMIDSIVSEGKRIDGRGYRDLRRTQFENGASGMCTVERDGTKLNSTVSVTTSRSPRTLECRHNLAITAAPFQMRSSRHHIRALEYDLMQAGQESSLFTEKALSPILPEFASFPYYVKVKCQALSMDGSFPTTNVCASSVALASAGVPLKYHVAGTSAGIVNQEMGEPIIILDLMDLEERFVDGILMLTSADTGVITSASLGGVKSAISFDSLLDALSGSVSGNNTVLSHINEICSLEDEKGSVFEKIAIPKGSRGKVIGPGGSHIKDVEALTGVIISLQEKEDAAFVYGTDSESCKKAIGMLMKYAGCPSPNLSVGTSYKVKVSKILEYGAVVEVQDQGGDGWIHISEIRDGHVKKVEDELSLGQLLDALCIGKNARGTPQLSLKAPSSDSSSSDARKRGRSRKQSDRSKK